MLEKDKEEVNKLIDQCLEKGAEENAQLLASLYQVKALWGLRVTLHKGFDDLFDSFEDMKKQMKQY